MMKIKRGPALAAIFAVSIGLLMVGIFSEAQSAPVESKTSSSMSWTSFSATPTATPEYYPDYTVLPSDTDGTSGYSDCPDPGIGCNSKWGESATDAPHLFYLPPSNEKG